MALLLALGFGGSAAYGWVNDQLDTPISTRSEPVNVKVATGESAEDIALDLKSKNLIRDVLVFEQYARITGARSRFQAGDYVLNRKMSMRAIVDALQHGRPDQVSITIPEGYTAQKVAGLVASSKLGTAEQYLAAVKDPKWNNDFLSTRPAGADLEGYLFPDTYSLDRESTPQDLVKAQLDRFGEVFTAPLRDQAKQAAAGRPAESVENIVILASLVERETNRSAVRPPASNPASSFRKRSNPGASVLWPASPAGVDTSVLTARRRTASSESSCTRSAVSVLCGIVTFAPAKPRAGRPSSASGSLPGSTGRGTYTQSRSRAMNAVLWISGERLSSTGQPMMPTVRAEPELEPPTRVRHRSPTSATPRPHPWHWAFS